MSTVDTDQPTTRKRRGTPRGSAITSAAARARWAPDARQAEAVRVLVAGLAPLSEDQKDQLRILLAPAGQAAQR